MNNLYKPGNYLEYTIPQNGDYFMVKVLEDNGDNFISELIKCNTNCYGDIGIVYKGTRKDWDWRLVPGCNTPLWNKIYGN